MKHVDLNISTFFILVGYLMLSVQFPFNDVTESVQIMKRFWGCNRKQLFK